VLAKNEEISGRTSAEAALRASELRYRTLVETAYEGIWAVDRVGVTTYVNPRLCRMLGYAPEELLGQPIFDYMPPATAFEARTLFARRRRGIAEVHELIFRRRDGDQLFALVSTSPLTDDAGEFTGALAMVTDISARKRAETALRESEARYEHIAASAPGVVYQFAYRPDGSKGFTFVSEGARRIFGVAPEAMLADSAALFNLVHPEDRYEFYATGTAAVAALAPWRWEGRAVLASGEERWVQVASRQERQTDGTILSNGLVMDVTDLRRVGERLAESEARFHLAARAARDVVYDWKITTDEHFWSETLFSAFGYDPAQIETANDDWWAALVHPDDAPHVLGSLRRALEGKASAWSEEYRFRRSDGTYATVLDRGYLMRDEEGRAVRFVGSMIDLSEHKELEAQLRQAQKMEAVGQLAGGVAHDFNNLLTVILSNATFIAEDLPADSTFRGDLEEIHRAALRAAELTKHLLAFSRKQVLRPRLLDVNESVESVAAMLRRLLSADIALETQLDPEIWPVLADPGQLEQVLMNLALNARDAMPDGGLLRLRTENVVIDATASHNRHGISGGAHVALLVEDTGTGIEPSILSKIFEPFFTTKGPGAGTGLGLATAYGIVKQSGGFISVDSKPGVGSRFTVLLPRSDPPVEDDVHSSAAAAGPTPAGETVLLVEDEATVRAAVRRMLDRSGYTVLEAATGGEALRIFETSAERIDVLLTDVVMPGQGGRALAEQLTARRPQLRVLFMSGYTDDDILQRGLLQPDAAFLEKPVTPDGLARALRQVLDRG
jgi:two-component system, cell cycle sensor histidine kinase and response regulator CckA